MKFFIVSLALVAFVAAQQDKPVAILKQAQDISPDGAYSFNYETENGIVHAESGSPIPDATGEKHVIAAQGEYHYTAPDGTPISVNYVADANGFQPQGAHIPQDHPVPALIQRALEYIAAHPPQPEN